MADQEVEELWKKFWEPLLTKPGYGISLDLIKKELYDFHHMIKEVPKVYMAVTDHAISKPNTDADTVIAMFHEFMERVCEDVVKDALEEHDQGMQM